MIRFSPSCGHSFLALASTGGGIVTLKSCTSVSLFVSIRYILSVMSNGALWGTETKMLWLVTHVGLIVACWSLNHISRIPPRFLPMITIFVANCADTIKESETLGLDILIYSITGSPLGVSKCTPSLSSHAVRKRVLNVMQDTSTNDIYLRNLISVLFVLFKYIFNGFFTFPKQWIANNLAPWNREYHFFRSKYYLGIIIVLCFTVTSCFRPHASCRYEFISSRIIF